jgi:hypothetical protein
MANQHLINLGITDKHLIILKRKDNSINILKKIGEKNEYNSRRLDD